MSDSSSSDDEESKFKQICDPTLWRTTSDGDVKGCDSPVEATSPDHYDGHSKDKQVSLLLRKIKVSLGATKTKGGSPWAGCDDSGTQRKRSRKTDVNIKNVSNPSTLSPYLAKQLALRLDGSVEYHSNQDLPSTNQETRPTDEHSFQLLKNVRLVLEENEADEDTQKRKRIKFPERLSYYSSDKELKTRCSSVAVTPEWILATDSCPRPHPKNLRYLDEYKLKERKSDGSIIVVPCSTLDSTADTKNSIKGTKKENIFLSQNGENNGTNQNEETPSPQNGVGTPTKKCGVKIRRKQTRKRGKKKKSKVVDAEKSHDSNPGESICN